jgi:hypothetical protein
VDRRLREVRYKSIVLLLAVEMGVFLDDPGRSDELVYEMSFSQISSRTARYGDMAGTGGGERCG